MEGIHILNQVPVMENEPAAMICVLTFFTLFGVFLCVSVSVKENKPLFISTLVGSIGCAFLFLLIIGIDPERPTGRYTYEVTLDDSISFKEFHDRYKVVEQRGMIWVIEDKEE